MWLGSLLPHSDSMAGTYCKGEMDPTSSPPPRVIWNMKESPSNLFILCSLKSFQGPVFITPRKTQGNLMMKIFGGFILNWQGTKKFFKYMGTSLNAFE